MSSTVYQTCLRLYTPSSSFLRRKRRCTQSRASTRSSWDTPLCYNPPSPPTLLHTDTLQTSGEGGRMSAPDNIRPGCKDKFCRSNCSPSSACPRHRTWCRASSLSTPCTRGTRCRCMSPSPPAPPRTPRSSSPCDTP